MHRALVSEIVRVCRQRLADGDCPREPAPSVESLEEAVIALAGSTSRTSAIEEIAAERRRQVEVEGWTPQHDDQHGDGAMAKAAACYAATGAISPEKLSPAASEMMTRTWPWARSWWKPRGGRADLIRAAALIVAEVERLDRAEQAEAQRMAWTDTNPDAR